MNRRTFLTAGAGLAATATGLAVAPQLAQAARATSIAVIGDSITRGSLQGANPSTITESALRGQMTWAATVNDASGYRVTAGIAYGGGTTIAIAPRVKRYATDYVVIMLGTNDIASEAADTSGSDPHVTPRVLARFGQMIRATGRPANRVIISTIAPFNRLSDRRQAFNRELRAYAAAHGHHIVDPWKQLDTGSGRFRSGLTGDGIHPNARGYRILGPAMVAELNRVVGGGSAPKPEPPAPVTVYLPVRSGDRGEHVRAVQILLAASGQRLGIDGSYGPETKRAVEGFQRAQRLEVDGVAGPKTLTALTPRLRHRDRHDRVKALQVVLRKHGQKVAVDGSFGDHTLKAVRAFQSARRLTVDGVVGEQTWAALIR